MTDDVRGNDSTHSWQARAATVGGVVLGLVLLLAAWGKSLDPVAFAEQITLEELDFLVAAEPLAWLLVVAEVVLGVALVLGLRTRMVLSATGLLVLAFVFLTARTYWRWLSGVELEAAGCGCFGNLVDRTPTQAFWQDLLLLVPFYAACWLWPVAAGPRRAAARWGVVVIAGLAAGAFTALAPGLPLDDLATRLAPGTEVTDLCAGSKKNEAERVCLDLLVPELEGGRHLVIIASLDSRELRDSVDGLNGLIGVDAQRVWVIDDAESDEQQLFFWETGSLFEVREVPGSLLRPLYRTRPRAFLVENGSVTRTWTGLPEFANGSEGL